MREKKEATDIIYKKMQRSLTHLLYGLSMEGLVDKWTVNPDKPSAFIGTFANSQS